MEKVIQKTEVSATGIVEQTVVDTSSLPIFILGIMPRSGTNYLANLICLHPDCCKSAFDEDYLLLYSDYLVKYAGALQNQWKLLEDAKDFPAKETLLEWLGNGLISFLQQSRNVVLKTRTERFGLNLPFENFNKRIVTKTPYVDNLDKFFKLFPNVHLLILIRDGRAIVESSVKSFKTDSEITTREWALSVDRLLRFENDSGNSKYSYLIVRYEDLFSNTENTLHKILEFLRLDKTNYNFHAAVNLPVVGSSTFGRDNNQSLNWNEKRKTDEFNPLARAANWTRAQHERFNWLAAKQLKAFSYEPKIYKNNRFFWTLWNLLLDLKWHSMVWIRRFRKASVFVVRRIKAYRSNKSI